MVQDPRHHMQGFQGLFQRYHIIFKQDTFHGLQGLQHHHVQGLHIIKNISNGSTIFLHRHKSTNTQKDGYKDLTTSLQHLMGFICMITRILHANDHISSKGHQTTIYVGLIPKISRTPRTP